MIRRALFFTAVLLALPSLGTAHVAFPGRPAVTPPPLTRMSAAQLVGSYLAYTPPSVRFLLRQSIDASHTAAYSDLVRAGLLKIVGAAPSGPRYDLTRKGLSEISSGFFVFGHQVDERSGEHEIIDFVEVPVGQFRYMNGTGTLHYFAGYNDRLLPEFTFTYQFNGNRNADALLRFGDAKDFEIANYGFPRQTLLGIGHFATLTLPIRACHAEWVIDDAPPYYRGRCSGA